MKGFHFKKKKNHGHSKRRVRCSLLAYNLLRVDRGEKIIGNLLAVPLLDDAEVDFFLFTTSKQLRKHDGSEKVISKKSFCTISEEKRQGPRAIRTTERKPHDHVHTVM